MQISSDRDGQFRPARFNDVLLEEEEIAVAVRVVCIDPTRCAGAKDNTLIPVFAGRQHTFEVGELAIVDIRLQLQIDTQKPPASGELKREVAPPLTGSPRAD